MKRLAARIIYYVGCVGLGAFVVLFVGAIGYAYWLDIQEGNWWVLPFAGICALGLAALIGIIVVVIGWALENK